MRGGQHALQLLVVEAVGGAVVVRDAAALGRGVDAGARGSCGRSDAGEARVPRVASSTAATASPAARRNPSRDSSRTSAVARAGIALRAEADVALRARRDRRCWSGRGRPACASDLPRVRAARHVVAPRAVPVALRLVVARRAVHLGEDLDDARRGAHALHLGQVRQAARPRGRCRPRGTPGPATAPSGLPRAPRSTAGQGERWVSR